MAQQETGDDRTGFDRILQFTIPDRDTRGRMVRLGPVLDTILSAHAYPLPIRNLLAEALVVTALLGSLLKDGEGQLTMQAQSQDGVVDLLVCDYRNGELRGYVRHDRARLDELGPSPSLHSLFGDGYLAITFDLAATGQRYQGIVPLEGGSLREACERYFWQSEQVPTLIRLGINCEPGHASAGGLLLQHLPEGEEGRERLHVRLDHPQWEHVSIMGGAITPAELSDASLGLEDLLWRLFHEEREVRVAPGAKIVRGCRCTLEHYRELIGRFPADEQAEMANEAGDIVVDCAFCSKDFVIKPTA
ncbi:Hsp33 family molecular chaperone HslO [Novosphingobium olei]|uniref:Hsp33 family molecular chaperone HslO n=1 Tax=Novosphingobium olei TaxID=2728851 RepID=A0A7Y0GBW9_9SPHN|nr:Hsp33 family molecular chaperone HslO [Novosphingobium olei]NML95409.1 Hsp33 family molecular chaperone HslO [Novosphingobium olei]BEU99019.1 Hsp33 family molecular chaperone HslO [Novosphingobium olei]